MVGENKKNVYIGAACFAEAQRRMRQLWGVL